MTEKTLKEVINRIRETYEAVDDEGSPRFHNFHREVVSALLSHIDALICTCEAKDTAIKGTGEYFTQMAGQIAQLSYDLNHTQKCLGGQASVILRQERELAKLRQDYGVQLELTEEERKASIQYKQLAEERSKEIESLHKEITLISRQVSTTELRLSDAYREIEKNQQDLKRQRELLESDAVTIRKQRQEIIDLGGKCVKLTSRIEELENDCNALCGSLAHEVKEESAGKHLQEVIDQQREVITKLESEIQWHYLPKEDIEERLRKAEARQAHLSNEVSRLLSGQFTPEEIDYLKRREKDNPLGSAIQEWVRQEREEQNKTQPRLHCAICNSLLWPSGYCAKCSFIPSMQDTVIGPKPNTDETVTYQNGIIEGLRRETADLKILLIKANDCNEDYQAEIDRLKAGKFTEEELQNLCHNLPDDSRQRFFKGCSEYQNRLFGCNAVRQETIACAAIVDDYVTEYEHVLSRAIIHVLKTISEKIRQRREDNERATDNQQPGGQRPNG